MFYLQELKTKNILLPYSDGIIVIRKDEIYKTVQVEDVFIRTNHSHHNTIEMNKEEKKYGSLKTKNIATIILLFHFH